MNHFSIYIALFLSISTLTFGMERFTPYSNKRSYEMMTRTDSSTHSPQLAPTNAVFPTTNSSSPRLLYCPCEKAFETQASLINHINRDHKTVPLEVTAAPFYMCVKPWCFESFNTVKEFIAHGSKHKVVSLEPALPVPLYTLRSIAPLNHPIAPLVQQMYKATGTLSTKTTASSIIYKCACEKVFQTRLRLKKHVDRDHRVTHVDNADIPSYKCPLSSCSQTFNSLEKFIYHCDNHFVNARVTLNTTTTESHQIYRCICEKAFKTRQGLKRHVNCDHKVTTLHSDDIPSYKCPLSSCSQALDSIEKFIYHSDNHLTAPSSPKNSSPTARLQKSEHNATLTPPINFSSCSSINSLDSQSVDHSAERTAYSPSHHSISPLTSFSPRPSSQNTITSSNPSSFSMFPCFCIQTSSSESNFIDHIKNVHKSLSIEEEEVLFYMCFVPSCYKSFDSIEEFIKHIPSHHEGD